MQLQLLLQTIIVPFIISGAAYQYLNSKYASAGILLAWLVSYGWVLGRIPFIPNEPVEQLWLFLSVVIIGGYFLSGARHKVLLAFSYVISIMAISWPVLKYQFELMFLIELMIFTLAGLSVCFLKHNNQQPAFSSAIGFTLLGFITAISGSLMIGQLSASLAAVVGVYALLEIKSGFKEKIIQDKDFSGLMMMYLLLLFIARVYAELDVTVVMLLVAASLLSLLSKKYTSLLVSMSIYLISIIIIFSHDAGDTFY